MVSVFCFFLNMWNVSWSQSHFVSVWKSFQYNVSLVRLCRSQCPLIYIFPQMSLSFLYFLKCPWSTLQEHHRFPGSFKFVLIKRMHWGEFTLYTGHIICEPFFFFLLPVLVTGNSQLNTSSLGLEVRSLCTVSVVNFLCKFIFVLAFWSAKSQE